MGTNGQVPQSIDDILAGIYQSHPPNAKALQISDDHDSQYDPESTLSFKSVPAARGSTVSSHATTETKLKPSPAPSEVASEIVTWPAAMKHVTRLSLKPDVVEAITNMITEHDDAVAEWNAQLYKAVERDREAKAGQKKINDALKAVGAPLDSEDGSKDDNVARYAKQMYPEQRRVYEEMSQRLATIGMPFFNTKRDLMTAHEAEGKLTESQLSTLRKRLIQHLEDVFREDS